MMRLAGNTAVIALLPASSLHETFLKWIAEVKTKAKQILDAHEAKHGPVKPYPVK